MPRLAATPASSLLCFVTFSLSWIFSAVSIPLEEVSVPFEDSLDTNQIEARAIGNFKIYWNVPTFLCHKHGLNFSSVSEKWGILQNIGDKFRGNQLSILYDPGEFPALLQTTDDGKEEPRNGGVPQEGNLNRHLTLFKKTIEKLLLSNFRGVGIIDFEHWRPIWRENWGILDKYREYSYFIEKKLHPTWSKYNINKEAIYRYESSAKDFMFETLRLAKKLFPKAQWGYYGYPFCFNYEHVNNKLPCTNDVLEDNNRLRWLFKEHTALFPSMYLRSKGMTERSNAQYIIGRMEEAVRVSKIPSKTIPIYAYTWYKYSDVNRFLTKGDLLNSIIVPKNNGASGIVIWGATRDVNTKEKCLAVYDYLERYLGPTVKNVLEQKQDSPDLIKPATCNGTGRNSPAVPYFYYLTILFIYQNS